jgi:hypothetical protein
VTSGSTAVAALPCCIAKVLSYSHCVHTTLMRLSISMHALGELLAMDEGSSAAPTRPLDVAAVTSHSVRNAIHHAALQVHDTLLLNILSD